MSDGRIGADASWGRHLTGDRSVHGPQFDGPVGRGQSRAQMGGDIALARLHIDTVVEDGIAKEDEPAGHDGFAFQRPDAAATISHLPHRARPCAT
jgi:hypothetical protein